MGEIIEKMFTSIFINERDYYFLKSCINLMFAEILKIKDFEYSYTFDKKMNLIECLLHYLKTLNLLNKS